MREGLREITRFLVQIYKRELDVTPDLLRDLASRLQSAKSILGDPKMSKAYAVSYEAVAGICRLQVGQPRPKDDRYVQLLPDGTPFASDIRNPRGPAPPRAGEILGYFDQLQGQLHGGMNLG